MNVDDLNGLSVRDAAFLLSGWCGAQAFVTGMEKQRPFFSCDGIHTVADQVLDKLTDEDWLEAFAAHPRLGDLESLKMKYAGNREWSAGEQSGVRSADDRVLTELAERNEAYFQRFGFIFILKATGKSAREMLEAIRSRINNQREREIKIAAEQQRLITHLRIDKQLA
ncbi:MAG: 2-oxo-4-hydroxy-4-carboxy-5-ureidoimidazoline decarboxylase [Planctomycetota bacterium]